MNRLNCSKKMPCAEIAFNCGSVAKAKKFGKRLQTDKELMAVIIEKFKQMIDASEGCGSMPKVAVDISRFEK